MTKFGGELNKETPVLKAKGVLTVHFEGQDAGNYDYVKMFQETYPELVITSSSVNIYYTQEKK